jgi:MFS family permease
MGYYVRISCNGRMSRASPRKLMSISSIVVQLFLVNLEISIVTTSLVAIANDLGGFENLSWVMSSYLLGYAGKIASDSILSAADKMNIKASL